mmetsp:Transcript_1723/g.4234  ORF Transcript_1723/g.4234 Transcript_1723/m.4234 type:complete len:677 (+) Transcript_1723:111-2141(+)|eukprot:jgi/Tetstr1/465707/TSEL_000896.t1
MAEEKEDKFLGIQSFPKVPEFEPDVDHKQTQWVRYGNVTRNVASREGWQWVKSEKQANSDVGGARQEPGGGPALMRTLSPMARARAPERVTVRVTQAPGIFSLPLKVKKTIRPNFKVKVGVSYRSTSGVSFVCTVKAHVLTENDRSDLPNWAETNEDAESWLTGTTSISHVFDDTVDQVDAMNRTPEVIRQSSLQKVTMSGYVRTGSDANDSRSMMPEAPVMESSPFTSLEMGFGEEFLDPVGMLGEGQQGMAMGAPDYSGARQMRRQASGAGAGGGVAQFKYMTHEFEFCDLKIIKPSRMKKVYMLFSVNVLDRDLLYAVYHVPTIVIAHITNQGVRALESLQGHVEKAPSSSGGVLDADVDPLGQEAQGGVRPRNEYDDDFSPAMGGNYPPSSPAISHPTAIGQQERAMQGGHFPGMSAAADASAYPGQQQWGMAGGTFDMGGMFNAAGGVNMERQSPLANQGMQQPEPVFYSIEAVREYAITKYETAGLTRPLTEMDMRILEVQAGFPDTFEARRLGMQISMEQWKTFQNWYSAMINLLIRIRTTWNHSDPTIVAGFDVGRAEAVRALTHHKPGTFMIRLSLSSPGAVVLSIKRPENEVPDSGGVVHALLEKSDLDGRRIDTWIRDFEYAQVLLDPYTGKRISKRDVFMPEYVRLASVEAKADQHRFAGLDRQ